MEATTTQQLAYPLQKVSHPDPSQGRDKFHVFRGKTDNKIMRPSPFLAKKTLHFFLPIIFVRMKSAMDVADTTTSSPFDMLPDELILRVINLAVGECIEYWYKPGAKQKLLVNIIARISLRFRQIAADKSFWEQKVKISGDVPFMKEVFRDFLNEGVKVINVRPLQLPSYVATTLSAYDITNLAQKCPQLEEINLHDFPIKRWPSLMHPWTTLQRLEVNMAGLKCFEDVALQTSAPNIRYLTIGGSSDVVLPDMCLCGSLQEVYLEAGHFSFPGKIPFPSILKKLCGSWYAYVNWRKEELENYFKCCEISNDLQHWGE